MIRESKGNMYPWVTHTWNAIKGKCSHDCEYCYMKVFPQKHIRLDEKELKADLGEGNFIFVGSSTDMWADDVPEDWIRSILAYCLRFKNRYLFQTKNPGRMYKLRAYIPKDSVLCATMETNKHHKQMGKAPDISIRASMMFYLHREGFETTITIEPIMDFDLDKLVHLIGLCEPSWVSIGADSKGHKLPEPDKAKIDSLINALEKFTKVKIKDNLKRLKEKE